MERNTAKFSPRNALGVISLFVGVVELAFAYPVTVLAGSTQIVFVIFMVSFPVLVLSGFFFVLLRYPENFYSPSDFEDPQAFTRLVERRDKKLDEHLNKRTKEFENLSKALQDALENYKLALEKIEIKVRELPELDRDTLEIDFNRVANLLEEAQEFLKSYNSRNLESYFQHTLSGVNWIYFNIDTVKKWSLDFLISAAVAALKDIREREYDQNGGSGTIVLENGDFDETFEYHLKIPKGKSGGTLKIKHTDSYCTIG